MNQYEKQIRGLDEALTIRAHERVATIGPIVGQPPHYVALKLAPGEALAIDGRLNDSAWAAVPWISDEPGGAGGFVDITAHADAFLNAVPALMQTRVKVRWDDDFFYVGAELEEPFVYADAAYVGDNDKAPYGDAVGDFEVFIDVAGTTEYYMEYEMGLLNCTYDIKWGKPDGVPLACGTGDATVAPAYCVNTSFHGAYYCKYYKHYKYYNYYQYY